MGFQPFGVQKVSGSQGGEGMENSTGTEIACPAIRGDHNRAIFPTVGKLWGEHPRRTGTSRGYQGKPKSSG